MRLTKRYIDACHYEGDGSSRDVRWDDSPRGLGLRIYPSGKKSFVVSYRASGRKRLYTLGAYGPLTLDKARDLANRRLGEIIDGIDPLNERRAERGIDTFAHLANSYLERHAKKQKAAKSIREDERIIQRELLPQWGSRRVTDIHRRDVIELLDSIVDRSAPIMANRVRALINKIFNFAISRDIVEANPCSQVKQPSREQPRQRIFTDAELKSLWRAFEELGPIMGRMFKLRLLTLQRGAEIATMRWDDLDLDGAWWTIPPAHAKNKLAHRVPLSGQPLAILTELEEYRHESGWVFPSPTKPSKPMINIGKAAERVKAKSNVADFRPHDLRRTGASRLTGMGLPRLTVAKLLNHVETGVTAVYDRHSYDAEKRRALDAWDQYVEAVINDRDIAQNVIQLGA